jgi:hypothetical protein
VIQQHYLDLNLRILLKPILLTIRLVFYYLILVLGEYNSPFFNKKKIITFLKSLNKYYKDYNIINNIKKRSKLPSILLNSFKKRLKDSRNIRLLILTK